MDDLDIGIWLDGDTALLYRLTIGMRMDAPDDIFVNIDVDMRINEFDGAVDIPARPRDALPLIDE